MLSISSVLHIYVCNDSSLFIQEWPSGMFYIECSLMSWHFLASLEYMQSASISLTFLVVLVYLSKEKKKSDVMSVFRKTQNIKIHSPYLAK